MKKCIYLAVLAVSVVACGGSDSPQNLPEPRSAFEYRGLDGFTIVDLEQTEGTVIAGTGNGIHKHTGNEDWIVVSPQDWDVLAITALYPSHLLASVQTGSGEFRLAESLNSGDVWTIVENDFGGAPGEQTEPILGITFNDAKRRVVRNRLRRAGAVR